MVNTKEFQLWLRIATGRIAAMEADFEVPAREVRVEVRHGGKWTEIRGGDQLGDEG